MSDKAWGISRWFEPVSLDDLNRRAALQTRVDQKYFVPWEAFEEFAFRLRNTHEVLEIEGRRTFNYDTMYFDSPSLLAYKAHIQGRRKRFKARSRHYVESGLCLFEVKLKGGRGETIKHKISYDPADYGRVTPAARRFVEECLRQQYGQELTDPLQPVLSTHYLRMTLTSNETKERITCDLDLAFSDVEGSQRNMSEQYVLVETKGELAYQQSDRLLWSLGVRPMSGSKYCTGVSLLRPELKSNRFRNEMKRYFAWPEPAAVGQPTAVQAAYPATVLMADRGSRWSAPGGPLRHMAAAGHHAQGGGAVGLVAHSLR